MHYAICVNGLRGWTPLATWPKYKIKLITRGRMQSSCQWRSLLVKCKHNIIPNATVYCVASNMALYQHKSRRMTKRSMQTRFQHWVQAKTKPMVPNRSM